MEHNEELVNRAWKVAGELAVVIRNGGLLIESLKRAKQVEAAAEARVYLFQVEYARQRLGDLLMKYHVRRRGNGGANGGIA